MTKEDIREITLKGFLLGLILFVSTFIYLLINKDIQHLQIVWTFIIPIMVGYFLLGMFIRWMLYRSTVRTIEFHLLSGPSIIYWIWMIVLIIIVSAYWIPQVIRYIILANVGTLLLVWILDCLYLKSIAKELNSGLEYYSRTLVEDLPARPKTKDIFMDKIYTYCKKNHLSLEIIEYGIPAKIKMNNTLYTVKLGEYYTLMGSIVYTLEFHNVVSKVGNNSN